MQRLFHLIERDGRARLKSGDGNQVAQRIADVAHFLGKRAGDMVEVNVPAGKMNFEILTVER